MGTAATLDEAWALVEAGQAHGVGSFDADGQPNTGMRHFKREAAEVEAQRYPDARWRAIPRGHDPFEQYWEDRRAAFKEAKRAERTRAKVQLQPVDDYTPMLEAVAAAESADDVLAALAEYSPPGSKMARAQVRGKLKSALASKYKELEDETSATQMADAWLSDMAPTDNVLQGFAFVADEVVPWEADVQLADVLDEVRATFASYVYATPEALDALTLWTTYTHLYDLFDVAPILDLSSPTKRCGKSSTLVVVRYLARAAMLSGNITPAALFRVIQAWQPTLLVDEADTFATVSDELRGIFNAGHTRDTAYVVRAEGDTNEPRRFAIFGPKAIAAIGHLPDTVEDRSVRIPMRRKPVGAALSDAFDVAGVKDATENVRRKLAKVALDCADDVLAATFTRPAGLHDRAWNNWKPLLSVAHAGGAEWFKRGVRAAVVLANDEDGGVDEDVLALQHVHEALKSQPEGKLATEAVLLTLIHRDDADWARYWARDVANLEHRRAAADLAKRLRPFGVKPRQLWLNGKNSRGYDLVDFEADDVAPYLSQDTPKTDARDARDARTGSTTEAGSSDPSDPSDLSGGVGADEAARADW